MVVPHSVNGSQAAGKHDVVIVGGGLIGASLACALQPTGLDVALIEAVAFDSMTQPSHDEKMLSLAPASQHILEGLGVWASIASHGVAPIERVHISDRGHWGKTRLSASEFNVPALGYVVAARVIGLTLVQTLTSGRAATVYCPARVTAIEPNADGVAVSVDTEDSTVNLGARLVVLADGGGSRGREMLGIRATVKDYRQTAILCTVVTEKPLAGTAFERFTDSGPLAMLPTATGRRAVVWTAAEQQVEEILGYPDTEFLERLQYRFGDWLGRLAAPSRRRSYPLKLVRVPNPVSRRSVAIGNAAHTLHPVAGQGFNLGLRDVAVLAEVLATSWADGRDVGGAQVLRRYRDWRRRDIGTTTRFTDGLIGIFANQHVPLVAGRNAALVTLNRISPAKRLLAQRTMGLSGRLPRLTRGLPVSS